MHAISRLGFILDMKYFTPDEPEFFINFLQKNLSSVLRIFINADFFVGTRNIFIKYRVYIKSIRVVLCQSSETS